MSTIRCPPHPNMRFTIVNTLMPVHSAADITLQFVRCLVTVSFLTY